MTTVIYIILGLIVVNFILIGLWLTPLFYCGIPIKTFSNPLNEKYDDKLWELGKILNSDNYMNDIVYKSFDRNTYIVRDELFFREYSLTKVFYPPFFHSIITIDKEKSSVSIRLILGSYSILIGLLLLCINISMSLDFSEFFWGISLGMIGFVFLMYYIVFNIQKNRYLKAFQIFSTENRTVF